MPLTRAHPRELVRHLRPRMPETAVIMITSVDSTAVTVERRGSCFDPELLDLFLENISLMRAIRLGNPA